MFKRLWPWLPYEEEADIENAANSLPITFEAVTHSERPPKAAEIESKDLHAIGPKDDLRWVMFKCPCTCGQTITLPMSPEKAPHWKISISESGLPTLYPSIWQRVGCKSHFWVRNGRVLWCRDTGEPYPWDQPASKYQQD